ncbi:uncharacterized protein LOC143208919 [Lasioglossum baleicum]|uniref:uncharacterized protein LOC143208919 n=1 Tax=Lasioglossum baleicum TaxID=434251 RepID=UPI003FCDCBB7
MDSYSEEGQIQSVVEASAASIQTTVEEEAGAAVPALKIAAILDGRYFKIAAVNDGKAVCVCQFCTPPKNEIKGLVTSSSNFRSHLKRKHPAEFERYSAETRRGRPNNMDRNVRQDQQSSMPTTPVGEEQQGEKRNNRQIFVEDMTTYVIHSMIPLKTVEDIYFRRMLKNQGISESVYGISRRTLGRAIGAYHVKVNNQIAEELKTVPFVCTTADIWSAQRRSFFGVTVHWISSDYKRKSAALACRRFPGVHSFDRITDMLSSIHAEFGLTRDKIVATVTDNATNFVKAFKEFGVLESAIQLENEEDDIPTEEEDHSEEEAEEEDDVEGYNRSFMDHILPRHIRCAAHTLSLCVTTDMMNTIRGDEMLSAMHTEVMQKCNILWKAAMRPKLAEEIQRIIGHALKRPGETRWNSLYDSMRQLSENRDKLTDVGRVLGVRNILGENDFTYIEEHLKCTSPIAEAIDILQGENNIFYGTLLPCLLSLRRKLQVLTEKRWTFCGSLSVHLLASLETRFKDHFGFATAEADNAGIAALSHPHFKNRWFNCIDENHRDALMRLFQTKVAEELKNSYPPIAGVPTTSSTNDDFFDFGESPTHQTVDYASKASLQILHFLEETTKELIILEQYPAVKAIFMRYNTPLPSSASVERLFSYATITNSPKSNRLSDKNFERRVVLKANLQRQ